MGHIEGLPRNQLTMFPEALDDYISAENPIRFVDAFVDALDFERLGFAHAVAEDTGRPPYHPADLVKLYLYGYLNRVRSSRRLECEAQRNVELMWLLRRLVPDFKTIADFRKDNLKALRQVCREFTLFCRELELFGGELVAIDGSKFKAVNSRGRNFSENKLKMRLKKIDKKIDTYLQELDKGDAAEADAQRPTSAELQEKIERMRQRRAELETIQADLQVSGESQVSLTDPDCRALPTNRGRDFVIGYNVQIAVDAKHKLILDHEVTNEVSDLNLLGTMGPRAREVLGVEAIDVVADAGYYTDPVRSVLGDGDEIKTCIEAGVTPYVPKTHTPSINKKRGLFTKDGFRYDADQDCYWCPGDQALTFRFESHESDGQHLHYYGTNACPTCALRPQCTTSKNNRRIKRRTNEAHLEDMAARALVACDSIVMRGDPTKMALRKQLVEHPFGTLKRSMNHGYFLMRGMEKVQAEMSLSVLAYNIRRVINILGVPQMIAALP